MRDKISQDIADKIIALLYREKRPGEDIVDNTDNAIANELNVPVTTVQCVLNRHVNEYYNELNKLRDTKRYT